MTARLTARAQAAIAETLADGGLAVDATAGNGHDTAFLARIAGPAGRVYAFDVQTAAIAATARRLAAAALTARVTLLTRSHADWPSALPASLCGHIDAVMFNLGYLPGSDKRTTTHAESTAAALGYASDWLARGGTMTVMAYRGHAGGDAETAAVAQILEALPDTGFRVARHAAAANGPVLWIVNKR